MFCGGDLVVWNDMKKRACANERIGTWKPEYLRHIGEQKQEEAKS